MKNFKTPKWDGDDIGDKTYDLVVKFPPCTIVLRGTWNLPVLKLIMFKEEEENILKFKPRGETFIGCYLQANLSRNLKKKGKKRMAAMSEKAKHVNNTKTELQKNVLHKKKNIISKMFNNESKKNLVEGVKNKKNISSCDRNFTKLNKSTKIEHENKEKLDNISVTTKKINELQSLKDVNKDITLLKDKKIKKKKKSRKLNKNNEESDVRIEAAILNSNKTINTQQSSRKQLKINKLKNILQSDPSSIIKLKELSKKQINNMSLRERMIFKLKSAQFRYINEQIYTTESQDAVKLFKEDDQAFKIYHEGYRQQVKKWPLNPLDTIISSIKKMGKNLVVADFGCGEAKLATSLNQKVFSFDLVAVNELVTVSDMSKVPLEDDSIDIVVCCLSLMGTNLADYIYEANRVLKVGGILKIAEVESRFDPVDDFIKGVSRFGFKKTWQDLSHNLFYFIDFKKIGIIKNRQKLPTISLHPCLYKKR